MQTTQSGLVVPAPFTGPSPALLDKFMLLDRTVNTELVEKEREIHAFQVALLSRKHMFQLGTPGIAKTLTFTRIMLYIAGAIFREYLMSKYGTPEKIFGPTSMKGLANDEFVRVITNTALEAHVVHFDEIFKSNEALLNDLLWFLNERWFDNGTAGKIVVPLSTMLCSSNELPETTGLNALADRIPIWLECHEVQDRGNRVRMYQIARDGLDPNPAPILDWNEITAAQGEVRQVGVPNSVLEKLSEVVDKLYAKDIRPTPRRQIEVQRILQAVAWLDGCPEVEVEHLGFLANCFWRQPEEIPEVESVVLELANPMTKATLDLLSDVDGWAVQVENLIAQKKATGDTDYTLAYELRNKMNKCNTEIKDLRKTAGNSRRQKETLDRCRERLGTGGMRLLREMFDLDDSEVQALLARSDS